MLAGGALVAVLLALVLPSVMNVGGRDGVQKESGKTADLAKVPAATPAQVAAVLGQQGNGNVQNASFSTANDEPATKALGTKNTKSDKQLEASKSVTKSGNEIANTKVNAPANSDDALVTELGLKEGSKAPSETNAFGYPVNRAETKYVAQIESQALAPGTEAVAMSTTCDPTTVYEEPVRSATVVTTLPRGTAIARLKIYSRLASLFTFGAGTAAGVPLSSSASSAKPKSSVKPEPKTQIWYFVRGADQRTGWIEQECATLAPQKNPEASPDDAKDAPEPQMQAPSQKKSAPRRK